MLVYVVLLSRAVPLLFWFSFCLVSARFLHDLFVRRGIAVAARATFISILIFGILMAAPYVRRGALIVSAEAAYSRQDWPGVADRLMTYESAGGNLDALFRGQLITALMNLRLWADAERELLATATVSAGRPRYTPNAVIRIGICRYYLRRFPESEELLRVDDLGDADAYLRHYFLGRLSEVKGDRVSSLRQYQKSLAHRPNFLPALYQYVRIQLTLGRRDLAAGALTAFGSSYRGLEQSADYRQLKTATAGQQAVPSPREFYIVEN